MTHVVRMKYRNAAVQPAGLNIVPNQFLSSKKKVPVVEEEEVFDDGGGVHFEKPCMCVEQTQDSRVDTCVYSEEIEYRRANFPSHVEKVKEHNKYMKQKLKHEKLALKMEQSKAQYEANLAKLENQKVFRESDLTDLGSSIVDFQKKKTVEEQEEDAEDEELDEYTDENFQLEALNLKEKKLLYLRHPHAAHAQVSKFTRRLLAFRIATGLYSEPNVKIRTTLDGKYRVVDNAISEILPWLYIGKVETAANEEFLTSRKFTHVINATDQYPNFFPGSFIYHKVPIDDDLDADAESHFDDVVRFIQRVEQCKGKLFVHCVVGASRAPTMVIAYLIRARNVTLWDAFCYVQARRSLAFPNSSFLFQLAKYEIKLGKGSSVKLKPEFQSYEFNMMKVNTQQIIYTRRSWGLFVTVSWLYTKQKVTWNLLS